MDVIEYSNLQTKNAVTLSILNDDQVFVTKKQYDPDTGQPLSDRLERLNVDYLKNQLVDAQALVTNLQKLLSDIDTVTAQAKPL